jgi:hypothetical protein
MEGAVRERAHRGEGGGRRGDHAAGVATRPSTDP